MVDGNVIAGIIIGTVVLLVAFSICACVILSQKLDIEHEEKEASKERALKEKQMDYDYKTKLAEIKANIDNNKPAKVNDPEKKASESELAQWFEIMSDPDKLFEDEPAKKEA